MNQRQGFNQKKDKKNFGVKDENSEETILISSPEIMEQS
jgi:hypothetical protein